MSFQTTTVLSQACTQTPGVIAFAESRFDTLTTSIFNQVDIINDVVIVVETSTPASGTNTLLLLDDTGNILNFQHLADSGCDETFVFDNDFFPAQSTDVIYELQMISVENLDTDLAIGQRIDELSGCFALSTPLVVNTLSFVGFAQLAALNGLVSSTHLNLFGGSIGVNDRTEFGLAFPVNICTIDSLNSAFDVFGDVGLNQRWVITDTNGVLIDMSVTPFSDFSQYVNQVDLTSNSHQLEMYSVRFVGGQDWLTIGNNIEEDICGGPIRSASAVVEISFIECEDTCSDGLRNGDEKETDVCSEDFSCSISIEREVPCFQDSTGMLAIEVVGGDDMLNFVWDTGDTTQVLENIPAGLYFATVTNSNSVQTTCNVVVTEPPALSLSIDLAFITSCTATANVTGGERPYTYAWNTGENFITVQNLSINPMVTVTDINQCTDSISVSQDAFAQVCGDCMDGIMNNDETGVDCGGATCAPCETNMMDTSPIQLTKSVSFVDENGDGLAQVGETLAYTFGVCNTSSDTLRSVTIEDPIVTVEGMAFDLDPNSCDVDVFTGFYTITDTDISLGSISNQASVSAMLQDGIMVGDLSDDPSNADNVDEGADGEPDDVTVIMLELPGPCGSPVIDTDDDGMCDILDEDDDNDGVLDAEDAFPFDPFESLDSDGDGFGDNSDFDDDNDFVDDRIDAFPLDPTESTDTDEDGIGNNADTDDDNDEIADVDDAFPLDASENADSDGDGTGDNADTDDDNDGCRDDLDPNPLVAGDDCEVDPNQPVDSPCANLEVGNDEIVFGGEITTEIGFPVDNVALRVLSRDNVSNPTFSNQDGNYVSDVVPTGFNYEIQASKEDSPFPGVSTLDMLFAQRHILRIEDLDSPYKIIAADVSGNQELSIVDIIVMRQLILGVIDEWNTGIAWNFVGADFNFFDPENPWPFADAITERNAQESDCNADFIAIRIGDVDNSFEAANGFTSENRSVPESRLHMTSNTQSDGSMVIDFYPTKDELLYGFQIALDGFDENSTVTSTLADLTDDNVHIQSGVLNISWTNPHGESIDVNEPLFSIKTQSKKTPTLHSSILHSEMYLGDLIETHSISLDATGQAEAIANVVVNPNPFISDVTIQFQQIKEQQVTFNLFSLEGKHVYSKSFNALKGEQVIKLTTDQISERGTYYYTLTSGSTRHSGSIIKVY